MDSPARPAPGLRQRLARIRQRGRRAILRRRRLLAALAVSIAVIAGLRAVTGPAPPTTAVQVAARDLSAGHILTSSDLTARSFSTASVPSGLVTNPAGERLATPLRRGEPVTDVRVSGEALLASYPLLSAVPIRIPDAGAAALLTPGDRIDVFATDPQGGGSRLLLEQAPVLAIPPADETGAQVSGPLGGRLVVLGVPPGLRVTVADATVQEFLSLSLSD